MLLSNWFLRIHATASICFLYANPAASYRYEKPEDWSIVQVPLPTLRAGDVLIKVKVSRDPILIC